MRYASLLDKIASGTYTRADLAKLRSNAVTKLAAGDMQATVVIEAIDRSTPKDHRIIFMGFCPAADFANRRDREWKDRGVCVFDYWESEVQRTRFEGIWPGDLIVLKKRHQFAKTMMLHGHGRVTGVRHDEAGRRFLEMAWSPQETLIEVPLMGCNSTVDVRTMERVEAEMPEEFFTWLGLSQHTAS